MKRSAVFVTVMLFSPIYQSIAQNTLQEAATGYNEKHRNDSIVNKTNKTIMVEIQCSKTNDGFLPNGKKVDYRSQEDLKKYAQNSDIIRSAQFFLSPNGELKFFDSFIKNNSLDKNTGYWILASCSVTVKPGFEEKPFKPLSIQIPIMSQIDVLYGLVKQREYAVSIINNELQVEAKNTL